VKIYENPLSVNRRSDFFNRLHYIQHHINSRSHCNDNNNIRYACCSSSDKNECKYEFNFILMKLKSLRNRRALEINRPNMILRFDRQLLRNKNFLMFHERFLCINIIAINMQNTKILKCILIHKRVKRALNLE
jgi:hypothetical protein